MRSDASLSASFALHASWLLLLASAPLAALAQAPGTEATITRWDVGQFDQPGQRSYFLRTLRGGLNGLPLGGGDVNGDGREDALLCAFNASEAFLFLSPPTIAGIREGVSTPGEVTRIFGAPTLGVECAAGDVNGDGLADLVLGAPAVTAPGRLGAGAVYVVFGSPALPAEVNLESTSGVLEILGIDAGDHFGVWVDTGDVDGDGIEDILIGAPDADGPGNTKTDAGEAYVLFGGNDLVPGSTEMSAFRDAGRLFTAIGAEAGDKAGSTADAGRIDAGTIGDFVVGSALNRAAIANFGGSSGAGDGPEPGPCQQPGARCDAGEVAIVFNPARGATVDLATPTPDVAFVFGGDPGDFAGEELDVADADGDGFGDVLIGALTANGLGNLRGSFVGEAYVLYGGDALRGQRIDLASPSANVTVIYGPTSGGITGDTARFIDLDGNGRFDVFVGSPTGFFLGPDGRERTGALFFLRSPAGRLPPVIELDRPPLETLPTGVILAADPGDILSYSLIRLDADGDGADDVLVNGMVGDGLDNQFPEAGEAYVIKGTVLAASLQPFASGDVTADSRVDVRDLQRTIAALVGRRQFSDPARRAADTNGNGTLDVGDLIGIVDRILQRDVLVPGSLTGGELLEYARVPDFTIDAVQRFALRAPAAAPRQSSATLTSSARSRSAILPIGALEASFMLSPGMRRFPAVVALGDAQVFTGTSGGKLKVIVLTDRALPVDQALFGFVGRAPVSAGVTAATLGGSLRKLEKAAAQPAVPARPKPRPLEKPPGTHEP